MKYCVWLGEYNRCFGEAAKGKLDLKANTMEEAVVEAQEILKKHNPDTYIINIEEVIV